MRNRRQVQANSLRACLCHDGNQRVCSRQSFGTIGRRRVDPDAVDLGLELLALVPDELDLAIPALGEYGSPRTQIQTRYILGLAVGDRGYAEQAGGHVVAGGTTQGDRMLTGHQGVVPGIIDSGISDITSGEYIGLTDHLEVAVDMQAPQGIALCRNLLCQ
ncbi:hypothetical protein D9M68_692520 [compost metagenome]